MPRWLLRLLLISIAVAGLYGIVQAVRTLARWSTSALN